MVWPNYINGLKQECECEPVHLIPSAIVRADRMASPSPKEREKGEHASGYFERNITMLKGAGN
jgi:hypothetical protein